MFGIDILACICMMGVGGIVGAVAGAKHAKQRMRIPTPVSVIQGGAPVGTLAAFKRSLLAANFHIGRLAVATGVTGRFPGGACLHIGFAYHPEIPEGADGKLVAYPLPSESCGKCKHATVWRLSQWVERDPGDVCLVCWKCRLSCIDVDPLPENSLARLVRQGEGIGWVLGRLAAYAIVAEAERASPLTVRDLDRVRRAQAALAETEQELVAELGYQQSLLEARRALGDAVVETA